MKCLPEKLCSALAVMGILVSTAQAAMVIDIKGDVLVNRGAGFVAVREPVELAPGDLVLAGAGGAARVDFGKGCAVPVKPNQIVRVSIEPPCRSKTGAETSRDPKAAGATAGSGMAPSALVLGGLAIVGGGGLAIGLAAGGGGGGQDGRPASP